MNNEKISLYYVGDNVSQYEYYARYFDAINQNGMELCNMNVYRGGKNFNGFVFEFKHASAENIKSLSHNQKTIYTVNNNGIADITKTDLVTGNVQELQCKSYTRQSWYNCDVNKYQKTNFY